jgi:hypothetical protein
MPESVFGSGRKSFFFEKKNQKTSVYSGPSPRLCHSPQKIRVFLLLFLQKKKCFLEDFAV